MIVKEFNISVDVDKTDIQKHPRAFFLTHTHADHLEQFFSDQVMHYLVKYRRKIYMTKLSYLFIKHMRAKEEWILDYIEILHMGTNVVTLPADTDRNLEEDSLTVNLLPAGHSVGAVMFLFLSTTLRVLFTGDFRISESDVEKFSDFRNRHLDALYVDTTFYDDRHKFFPKRSEVIDVLVEHIDKWLNKGEDYRVGLSISATTGYEDMFTEIYKKTGMRVCIMYGDKRRLSFYRAISNKVPSISEKETKIHLCNYRAKTNHEWCGLADSSRCLRIRFSAMPWKLDSVDQKFYEFDEETNTLNICYATHCSSIELKYFINYFKCNRIIGHPNEYVITLDSNNCGDIFKDKTKSVTTSGICRGYVCKDRVVPASVVRSLMLFSDDD